MKARVVSDIFWGFVFLELLQVLFCSSYTQLLLRIPKILTLAFSSSLISFSILPITYCLLVPLSLQLLCSSLVLWDPSLLSAVCSLLSNLSPLPWVFWDRQDRKVPQARKLQAGLTSFCPAGRSQELVRLLNHTVALIRGGAKVRKKSWNFECGFFLFRCVFGCSRFLTGF